jgi:hypothetical protein
MNASVHVGSADGMEAPSEYLDRCAFDGADETTYADNQVHVFIYYIVHGPN